MSDDKYPALFRAADQASLYAQTCYVRLFGLHLALLIAAGLSGLVSAGFSSQGIAYVTASLFALSIVIGIVMRLSAFERTWYEGRAIAESAKSMAWKYMMRARPYDEDNGDAFLTDLDILRNNCRHVRLASSSVHADPQITQTMRDVRGTTVDERRIFYVQNRIREQRNWYNRKAAYNAKRHNVFFWTTSALQAIAIPAAFATLPPLELPVPIEGLLATIVAALLAWLQLRRHYELGQSYALATQELGMIEERSDSLKGDNDFAQFVSDSETAMSREHTMWRARREVT